MIVNNEYVFSVFNKEVAQRKMLFIETGLIFLMIDYSVTEDIGYKTYNITFKDDDTRLQFYEWCQSKGVFLKTNVMELMRNRIDKITFMDKL